MIGRLEFKIIGSRGIEPSGICGSTMRRRKETSKNLTTPTWRVGNHAAISGTFQGNVLAFLLHGTCWFQEDAAKISMDAELHTLAGNTL